MNETLEQMYVYIFNKLNNHDPWLLHGWMQEWREGEEE